MTRPEEKGSATLELVVLTPVLVGLLLLVVAAGRLVDARSALVGSARSAARAATTARSPEQARRAATAITDSRSRPGPHCGHLAVTLDTTAFRAGGTVTATVTCTVSLSDLVGLSLPGYRTLTARATEPLDTFTRIAP